MNLEAFDDIIDTPYQRKPPSTADTKETLHKFRHRCRSSVRISTQQIMEDDAFKQARNEELEKELP